MKRRYFGLAVGFGLFAVSSLAQPRLDLPVRQANGWWNVRGQGEPDRVLTLQTSTNLLDWGPIAVLFDKRAGVVSNSFEFLDASAPNFRRRFYRCLTTVPGETNDWKNQVRFPDDLFVRKPGWQEATDLRWVKFAILLNDPYRVFYQDSTKYLLHYDFAVARLEPFQGLSRTAFDEVSLYRTNQQVVLGSLLFPPAAVVSNNIAEYGIQLTGRDPYPREFVCQLLELLRSTVIGPGGTIAYYFPAFEQTEAATRDETYFAQQGIEISTPLRWVNGEQVYSAGWALGRIKSTPATEINVAYSAGRLASADILLTDGVPAEIPFVSGIVTLAPATPNSHVAIQANAYRTPFAYAASPAQQERVRQLAGHEVAYQTSVRWGLSVVDIFDVEGSLDPAIRAELLALKQTPPVSIKSKAHYCAFAVAVEGLVPDDIRYVGGKAANFGIVRRLLPTNSPPAIAFTFDLWDEFMDQVLPSGKTLRVEIRNRLGGLTYPPSVAALQADLAVIRDLITKTAQFTSDQQQAITNALVRFDPLRNIRFRSSSNAEDAQNFSAAGLYDSYSGCLADDLDGDSTGPCRCDSTEANERGVFRAIRKVYASFYNNNAFLERLRHGIDESQVGMALLVHHSTPDAEELANGVATVSWDQLSHTLNAQMVTQAGAVSVTNPEGDARPEIVVVPDTDKPHQQQSSSLVPLGSRVLNWPTDYQSLARMLFLVYSNYCGWLPGRPPADYPVLDFEYKKALPGLLRVKQVREVPQIGVSLDTPYLLDEPTTYGVYQGEYSSVFANHRAKCRLTLQTKTMRLSATNVADCLYTDGHLEYREGTNLLTLNGAPSSWPMATHAVTNVPGQGTVVEDCWTLGTGPNQRRYCLHSAIPVVNAAERPLLTQREIQKWLSVEYATPVLTLDRHGIEVLTNREEIGLIYQLTLSNAPPTSTETFETTNGVSFKVSYLDVLDELQRRSGIDPNPALGPIPLPPLAETCVTGLTAEPLVLRNYYAQSAAPGHWSAEYLFEPRVDPNVPTAQLRELEAADIALIYVFHHITQGAHLQVVGADGRLRPL